MIRGIAIGFSLFAFAPVSSAQENRSPESGDRYYGAWIGVSPDSPVGSQLGVTPDRRLLLIGVRAQWVLESFGPLSFAAVSDLIPVAALSNNPKYRTEKMNLPDGTSVKLKVQTGRSTVYGAGISPVGVQLSLSASRGISIFGACAVGALWFTRDTPVPDSRRFNITFEYGGGIEFSRVRHSVLLGYKFHHLSNVYSAPMNPGVDGNVFYVGLLRRR